ncbi:1,4-beta-xylanase [Arthrobacter agilis]|uniref:endo-1,4-beta-xylanase n=1 Tax=Arthrobacter agilis TaxID=37921 RepID=UPI000B34EA1C|nr:endo-1,4-beta-xylanase [Arthrobacter agilis]OUM44733.1 1,4-beta-xylanase [Arthrobacter agilis]PPB47058.1 1,4-beta-xylanase [Arthrobacter agilis]TPV22472.1 1,4-beta-xylanase [Arthrobacter agilis]VDR32284.1 Endo-1,4-beta-xylanase A precursor [Arthrobacter agilis]
MSVDHRRVTAQVTVLDSAGNPVRDGDVTVEQQRHDFAFGNIGFDFIPLANEETAQDTGADSVFGGAELACLPELETLWLELFNTATLPFYWRGFEPTRGKPDTRRLHRTAWWFAEHGVTVKGHPLTWHTLAPEWLTGLPVAEIERLQRERIRREVTDFSGVVDTWDAINEVVIMPVFTAEENGITRLAQSIGRVPMVRLAFEEARASNPSATLILNDFDLSSDYEALIEGVLEAGITVDAIGLQTHMHQGYWGEETMLATVDRFARFGLPLHLTETTLLSGDLMPPEIVDLNDYQIPSWPSTPEGEARQADEIVRHYRSLVGHPAVQAITYWGLTDDGAWLGAPGGLVRTDGTPKPSFDALRSLIKGEWWLPRTTMRTDQDGRLSITGFLGDYVIERDGQSAPVSLSRGRETATVRFR